MKKQIFTLAISFIINMFCLHSFSQTQLVQVTGMTATASSQYVQGSGPENAVDGLTGTAWCSQVNATGQWLQVSLPETYTLSSIEILWGPPYTNCTVQFYNNSTLVETYSLGSNSVGLITTPVTAPTSPVNKIKVTSDLYLGSSAVAIYEVKVFRYLIINTVDQINASTGFFTTSLGVGKTSTGSTSLALKTSATTGGYSSIQSTKSIGTAGGGVLALNPDGGNVGIGTVPVNEKLEVAGNVKATKFIGDGSGLTGLAPSQWATNGTSINYNSGNVLIGKTTQTNTNYILDVNGKVRANEVTVNTTGADFVFEKNYKLRPLCEVESFIKANKRLPDIAPASMMQTNGVSVGEMQAKLLQKVEELTLYTIVQEKANAELKQKLSEQEKKLAVQEKLNLELRKKMDELSKLITTKLQ